jgi:CDP-diacylglycerol--glycerol-3-phosphate 3-phosphatidyltransferase
LGFAIVIVSAVLVAQNKLLLGGLLFVFGSLIDMLDGALARKMSKVSRFGAVLDSTLDRLSEAAVLIAALYLFASQGSIGGIILVGIVMTFSVLVSYLRARAEALGLECVVGFFTRPERVILLTIGFLTGELFIALVLIAVFSITTAIQRFGFIYANVSRLHGER